ncbi:MAG TPA: isoprenylcysteine carboxylmethyltransferase family protein [Terriglobales bacterium]|jgi:protein-S-isoprenylcysteine O-methyltransferase Ste14|nr:isoprenylcysteine carboxylmethyltransferase family protein [Terriglobales bacterium]
MNFLRAFAWLACSIYATIPCFWLLIHPFAETWRQRRGSRYRILLPAWVGMWMIAAALTRPWRESLIQETLIHSSLLGLLAGLPLIAAGIFLYSASRQDFSAAQLGGRPEIEARPGEQRLITSGIRQRVRHPIYLGHLLEMLGWTFASGTWATVILTAFAVVTGAWMIRMEEAELERRFGDSYRRYCQRVPAIFPAVF